MIGKQRRHIIGVIWARISINVSMPCAGLSAPSHPPEGLTGALGAALTALVDEEQGDLHPAFLPWPHPTIPSPFIWLGGYPFGRVTAGGLPQLPCRKRVID